MAALRFAPFYSGSTWDAVFRALWDFVQGKRGKYVAKHPGPNGPQVAPRLTNGEVITVIMAWMPPLVAAGARMASFPLWDQFAAAAYNWNPTTGRLDTSTANRDDWYPDILLAELWSSLYKVALDLNDTQQTPRIDMDGRWDDIVFQSTVKSAVSQDAPITTAADASAAFNIPIPGCKGPDGKLTPPKCKRQMKRYPYLCEEYEKCDGVSVKDPITVVRDKASNMFSLALLVGVFWLMFNNEPSRPRRRTRAR